MVDVVNLITTQLAALTAEENDYWSFRGKSTRSQTHAYFQYPAMMVPQVQGVLLDVLLIASPDITSVYDPFAGSGTVLTEAIIRGLNFTGNDINPLSVLLCRSKSELFRVASLGQSVQNVVDAIRLDTGTTIDVDF